MRANADTSLNVEKFQQELTRTANRLSRACDLAIEQFGEGCGASSRSLQGDFAVNEQRLLRLCNSGASELQEEKDALLRNLTASGQAEICNLVELARSLRDDLQSYAVTATTEVRLGLQESLDELINSLSAAELVLSELRSRMHGAANRFSFAATSEIAGTVESDSIALDTEKVAQSVIEGREKAAEATIEEVSTNLTENVGKRNELLVLLREATNKQRENLTSPFPVDDTLAPQDIEMRILANLQEAWVNESHAMADIVRDLHEGTMSEILQSSRMEAEQMAFDYEAKILSICGQLALARREAEDEYALKVQQVLQRTEELITAERSLLQQGNVEMGDKIENEAFKELTQLYSATKAEATQVASAAGGHLIDDFNTRVYAHLNHLEARKRELCDQFECLSKEYAQRLELRSNELEIDLQNIRLEIEVLEQETSSWISAVSFYSASIGKL